MHRYHVTFIGIADGVFKTFSSDISMPNGIISAEDRKEVEKVIREKNNLHPNMFMTVFSKYE